VNIIINI